MGERTRPSAYPECVNRLMDELADLPGIGRRTAERLAFHFLRSDKEKALGLATALKDIKTKIRHCSICSNLTDDDPCRICADAQRQHESILVVDQPKDLLSLEQTGQYRGGYHVLMGHLSPLDGVEPDDLTIAALLRRIDHPAANAGGVQVREVIFGLSPDLDGDGTVLYLADQLKTRNVTMSRLARGLPAGSRIEYANKAVLADAILGRQPVS